ncbi:zinc-ribbon and DUF3426 domain-containing protein [Roseateles sp. BYS87W]|uniref:Zinc-ribbon and DUF3426 domain-containing protein n=1 Tax=Pelomonas baiyunensis TaxID=3299026 RepID=A0ABW7GU39_9BURK
MSLATRCTACGTIFRIVEDQLRVSDGWVRCGRCAEIFDARELLFDIERDAPPPWPAAFTPPSPPPLPQQPPAPAAAMADQRATSPVDDPVEPWMPPPEPEAHPEPLPTGWPAEPGRQEPRWMDTVESGPTSLPPGSALDREPTFAAEAPAAEAPAPAPAAQPDETPAVVPDFMRHAEREARWNRPGMKWLLGLVSGLLLALLALQVTVHFRNALVAQHPALRPVLEGLCEVSGCEVGPWRRIDALTLDTTALNPAGGGAYKLSLTLRNKTAVPVAMPSIELSLTDASGAAMARKVLGPELFTPSLKQVPGDAEQPLSFVFSTGGQRVNGYSVNLFYP